MAKGHERKKNRKRRLFQAGCTSPTPIHNVRVLLPSLLASPLPTPHPPLISQDLVRAFPICTPSAVMNFPSHFQHIFKQLNHQRLQAQLCDCVVVVGGQTFQAHRSILAACSSHFRALLTSSDTADEAGGSGTDRCRDGPNVIELDPEVVTPESFSTLLDMIYTSTLSLGTSNVMDVLLAASHLHLNAVVKACKIHLSRKNFPASAPKGWRSVQQQKQESPSSQVAASPATCNVGSLQSELCTDLRTEEQEETGDLDEDSADGEGLDSLSDLAFSCFLNPGTESVMGALEEDDSLASLTAAATALLPTQSPGFSDTIILQPTQSSLTGFLSTVRPPLSVGAPVVQPSRAGKSSGATTFRRIAPKTQPGSEAGTELSHGSGGDVADRPPLTRASEDVLSKCKKAAAEDHVLLVEGEKKYACKICCKTFMNLTDCKKHIRVHTGEKPYPCPKCGKRFSQSSHLYKHSKNTCLNWKDDQSLAGTLL
uniref:Zinc finger and BTB domain containing 5 n=1 Tax=Neolamprologus brichardi TaxID=32507 RepID=A0A3Q4H7N5_NEOBR